MLDLLDYHLTQLEQELANIGEKTFRAKQIWNWIYQKNVFDFKEFSNISSDFQNKLIKNFALKIPKITKDQLSLDGTRKWLLEFHDNQKIEMVFIPEEKRGTLCVSSQIGCTLTCKFCHTGTQRLIRNLEASEIIWQFLIAKNLLEENITNIVFMGMGEPLFNYQNVKKSIHIINDKNGLNFSKRRITLSTSGVVPELLKFCDEVNTGLAISLHAANDDLRTKIMPINNKYPLADLLNACSYYQKNNSQKITFEYVMLKDVNDSDQDALDLIRLIKKHRIHSKINIIPFNSWQNAIYKCSSNNRIASFAKIIKNSNIEALIRKTRGEDIMAACGQLKSLSI